MPAGDLVAFATSHFIAHGLGTVKFPACSIESRCALLQWLRQTQALAELIAEVSGEGTSVHLFSACLSCGVDVLMRRIGRAPVIVHETHAPELEEALQGLHRQHRASGCCPGWDLERSSKFRTLLKWQFVSEFSGARLVVVLDLDMEVNPRHVRTTVGARGRHAKRLAHGWVALLRCALRNTSVSLLSWADHSSPVNAGFMLVQPSTSLYDEGVQVLRRARYNATHGWGLIGSPFEAIRAEDDAWRTSPGWLEMLNRSSWAGFVHGSLDQGLFFYMFRVLHRAGADLSLTDCASRIKDSGGGIVKLHHYLFGCKPENCLRLVTCNGGRPFHRNSYAPDLRHGTNAARIAGTPKFLRGLFGSSRRDRRRRTSIFVIARTISWGERTAEDLRAMMHAAELNRSSVGDDAFPLQAVREVAECEAVLRRGARCVDSWLGELQVAPCGAGRACEPAETGKVSARRLVEGVLPRRRWHVEAMPTQPIQDARPPGYQTPVQVAALSPKARWQAWRVASGLR